MNQQKPVVFNNRQGLRLFGILHTPAQHLTTNLGVILLSPGVKMRVGPQCLYRRMTNEFLRLGITVFRFDFYGLGDSEGMFTEALLRDFYNHIEVGRFVDDTIDAMNWMETHCGTKRFILSGLCGGAITGLLAGSRDRRVAGLLGLGTTPVLASRSADESRYMTVGMLENRRRQYLRRLLSPSAWFRLFTLKTDNRAIWKTITLPFRRRQRLATPSTPPTENDNANPLFPPAFFAMLETGRPMLFVFGGSDRLRWEFDEKFVARYRDSLAGLQSGYDVHVVEDANHVFSLVSWQDEMLRVATGWIERRFGNELPIKIQSPSIERATAV